MFRSLRRNTSSMWREQADTLGHATVANQVEEIYNLEYYNTI